MTCVILWEVWLFEPLSVSLLRTINFLTRDFTLVFPPSCFHPRISSVLVSLWRCLNLLWEPEVADTLFLTCHLTWRKQVGFTDSGGYIKQANRIIDRLTINWDKQANWQTKKPYTLLLFLWRLCLGTSAGIGVAECWRPCNFNTIT